MAIYVTLESLKSAIGEVKSFITNKFYSKNEIDNNLTEFKNDLHTETSDTINTLTTVTVPTQVDTIVGNKLTEYDTSLDSVIQTKVDAKELDTSGLVTKAELDIATVITTNNLVANNIATIHDLPTALGDTEFSAMVTDLTTDGGVY